MRIRSGTPDVTELTPVMSQPRRELHYHAPITVVKERRRVEGRRGWKGILFIQVMFMRQHTPCALCYAGTTAPEQTALNACRVAYRKQRRQRPAHVMVVIATGRQSGASSPQAYSTIYPPSSLSPEWLSQVHTATYVIPQTTIYRRARLAMLRRHKHNPSRRPPSRMRGLPSCTVMRVPRVAQGAYAFSVACSRCSHRIPEKEPPPCPRR